VSPVLGMTRATDANHRRRDHHLRYGNNLRKKGNRPRANDPIMFHYHLE
jgi:hypothetical protein